jgi:flagellar assembly factor FliW
MRWPDFIIRVVGTWTNYRLQASQDERHKTMNIETTRFGRLNINSEDTIRFPQGLIGFEDSHDWIILADSQDDSLGWLQSTTAADLAFAVVSPRRYVPGYRVRVSGDQAETLSLEESQQTYVLVIVSQDAGDLSVNLRAPILINLTKRIGRQVITTDDQPLRHPIVTQPAPLRKSA